MSASIRIRNAEPSDAEAVETLFREFVRYLRSIGDDSEYRFSARQYLDDGFGADPVFRGLVAVENGNLAGYLLFSRGYNGEYLRYLYVVDVYVRETMRGRGIGKMLMNEVCDIARREGIRRVYWSVHKNNADAVAFYERLGANYVDDCHRMYLEIPD